MVSVVHHARTHHRIQTHGYIATCSNILHCMVQNILESFMLLKALGLGPSIYVYMPNLGWAHIQSHNPRVPVHVE